MEISRQGLIVSIDELRDLADELESQCRQLNLELENPKYDCKHKFQINIINKEECSDTWRIEDFDASEVEDEQ